MRRKDAARGRALRMEELEERRVLATLIVNNLGDLDDQGNVVVGSLRQAVALSNSTPDETDTIVFADYLFAKQANGATSIILLDGRENGQQLLITDEVQILGPGPGALQIVAAPTHRIFETNIDSDEEVRAVMIGGVTLSGGSLVGTDDSDDRRGGAIFNREGLTLVETIFAGNSASQGGGAIYSPIGSLNIDRSLFSGNSSGGGGGAILLGVPEDDELRPGATVTNTTFTSNSTSGLEDRPGYGGGIYNRSGRLDVTSSTFVGNSASTGGGGIATNGVTEVEDDPPPAIVTTLSHSILHGNTGASNSDGNADDVFAIRLDLTEDDASPLAPTLLIDSADGSLGYNFIGRIGGTEFWDPDDEMNPGNGHFYQAVEAADGISWTLANAFTTFGQNNPNVADPPPDPIPPLQGSHLATPSSAEENMFVFESLVSDPALWATFQPPDTESDPAETPPEELIGPWIGALQTDTSLEFEMMPVFDQGWEWVTAPREDFSSYSNWADMPNNPLTPAQPDNGIRPDIEEPGDAGAFAHYFGVGVPADTWGDLPDEPEGAESPIAYVIEYDAGTNYFGVDPLLTNGLTDPGGSVPVFYPTAGSLVVDGGNPGFASSTFFDQRGRHFTRVFGGAIDIGAVEVQQGNFVVDSLDDEEDRQYSPVYRILDAASGENIVLGYDVSGGQVPGTQSFYSGDFSLREAIDFAEKNPGPDIISFEPGALPELLNRLDDPTFSAAPTIKLELTTVANTVTPADPKTGLTITESVSIIGPSSFVLEIDAAGNDLTPNVDDNAGTRVFNIDNFDTSVASDVFISNLTLQGGDVVNNGGAILNSENLTLSNIIVTDNASSTEGGGIYTRTGDLTIESSTLHNNRTGGSGGGLFVESKFLLNPNPISAVVHNSTISGNTAGLYGAGVYNENGEVLIEYSTITENNSPFASGVASAPGADTFTQVSSSIIAGNFGDDITLLPGATNIQSLGFNLVGVGNVAVIFTQIGDHFNVIDPMLGPLADTGGQIPTHRLLAGSPAIDAGSPVASPGVAGVPLFDQRGSQFGRVFDGTLDGKDRIDIGAYELQATTFVVDTLVDENDGVISAGNFSLREAIEASNSNPFADTITFAPSLVLSGAAVINQTPRNDPGLLLQGNTPTDMRITDSVNIVGLGSSLLFLDGSAGFVDYLHRFELPLPPNPLPRTRFFTIDDGDGANRIDVNISDLTFINSLNTEGHGGALKSVENLSLDGVEFTENSTFGDGLLGGAVYQSGGTFAINGSRLAANSTSGTDSHGGAIYATDANVTVQGNTQFLSNLTLQANSRGAGLYANNSTVTIDQSSLAGNVTAAGNSQGAGVYAVGSTVDLTNALFSGNRTSGAQSRGAGLYAGNSTVTISDSTFVGNKTLGTFAAGAGVFFAGGNSNVFDSTFDLNTTQGAGSGGAALAGDGAQTLIERSSFTRGTTSGSDAPGGAILNLNGNLTVRDSTVSGNATSGLNGAGGGIFSDTNLAGSQRTLIVNSTVSGNSAGGQGGGVHNADGLTVIKHSTITDNTILSATPFGFGSGVSSNGNTSTRTEIGSSIVSGNNSSDVDHPGGTFANSFVSLGYNVIGVGLSTSEFVATGDVSNVLNPLLGPLANNGGPTMTHAPLQGSPAIEAGNPQAVAGIGDVPAYDQKGLPRVQGPRIDIGAVEAPAAADFDENGYVSGLDFLLWQRGYGVTPANKIDGDANNDGQVDALDLGIWEAGYGVPAAQQPLAAIQSGNDDTLPAALHANSEPLTVSALLDLNALPSGLTRESSTGTGETTFELLVETENAEQADGARDLMFTALAQGVEYRGLGDIDNQEIADDEDEQGSLELSVEDQVFDSLGA